MHWREFGVGWVWVHHSVFCQIMSLIVGLWLIRICLVLLWCKLDRMNGRCETIGGLGMIRVAIVFVISIVELFMQYNLINMVILL